MLEDGARVVGLGLGLGVGVVVRGIVAVEGLALGVELVT